MGPLVTSSVIFVFVQGGIFLGKLLRITLPESHLSKGSEDTVRLGASFIATIVALLLGLMLNSAKNTFDMQNGQIKQVTADIILLDNLLAEYGSETLPIRRLMRSEIAPFTDSIWKQPTANDLAPFEFSTGSETIYQDIITLSPQNDVQRSVQARAIEIQTDIAQARLLLFTESNTIPPKPFLLALVIWLIAIFASFSLFSDLNLSVLFILSFFSLSTSFAIFLILELSNPFVGLMQLSSASLRSALLPLLIN